MRGERESRGGSESGVRTEERVKKDRERLGR